MIAPSALPYSRVFAMILPAGQRKATDLMKIPLHIRTNSDADASPAADREQAIERDIKTSCRGDWEAKARLVRQFMPLLTSLASRRSTETPTINRLIEAGKNGMLKAARKFPPNGHVKFEIFALQYIDDAMNRTNSYGGFWARLFRGQAD